MHKKKKKKERGIKFMDWKFYYIYIYRFDRKIWCERIKFENIVFQNIANISNGVFLKIRLILRFKKKEKKEINK